MTQKIQFVGATCRSHVFATKDPALFEEHMIVEHGTKPRKPPATARPRKVAKASELDVARAERSAAFITFKGEDGAALEGQVVAQAPAIVARYYRNPRWVIPTELTGREFQGCLLVAENCGADIEVAHHFSARESA